MVSLQDGLLVEAVADTSHLAEDLLTEQTIPLVDIMVAVVAVVLLDMVYMAKML
jgi:hypothetical protein